MRSLARSYEPSRAAGIRAQGHMAGRANRISAPITAIAAASRGQAPAPGRANTRINDMDKVTQQKAALAEPSTAARHDLLRSVEARNESLTASIAPHAPAVVRRQAPRAQAPVVALKTVGHPGSAAVRQPAPPQGADQWEEF